MMNKEEFSKKWKGHPSNDDYEQFMIDAESVGNLVEYRCMTVHCEFKTCNLDSWKSHSKIKSHFICETSVMMEAKQNVRK